MLVPMSDPAKRAEHDRLAVAGYRPSPGGAWYRPAARPALEIMDFVLFDVDGVLMDTHLSYPHVIADAVQRYFERVLAWPGGPRLLHPEETRLFKLAGGFNSDWRCARAGVFLYLCKAARLARSRAAGPAPRNRPLPPMDLALLREARPGLDEIWADVKSRGGGWDALREVASAGLDADDRRRVEAAFDPGRVDAICCELYGGEKCDRIFGFTPRDYQGPGYIGRERPLVRAADLEPLLAARPRLHLGLYTGRTDAEAEEALAATGLDRLLDRRIAITSSRFRKPDPQGLVEATRVADPRAGLLCGDNIDDWQIVARYRALEQPVPVLFAGILGGAPGPRALDYFIEQRVDVIAPHVRAVASLLQETTL